MLLEARNSSFGVLLVMDFPLRGQLLVAVSRYRFPLATTRPATCLFVAYLKWAGARVKKAIRAVMSAVGICEDQN